MSQSLYTNTRLMLYILYASMFLSFVETGLAKELGIKEQKDLKSI